MWNVGKLGLAWVDRVRGKRGVYDGWVLSKDEEGGRVPENHRVSDFEHQDGEGEWSIPCQAL